VEIFLQSTSPKPEQIAAPADETAETTLDEKLWYPIELLVRLRAFEALRHREYRLLWYAKSSHRWSLGWTR